MLKYPLQLGCKRKCWNRQTGTFEVRVSMTCGFKSHLPHQNPECESIRDFLFIVLLHVLLFMNICKPF